MRLSHLLLGMERTPLDPVSLPPVPADLAQLSDHALLAYAGCLGRVRSQAYYRLLATLPELARRGLWKAKGFASLEHMAKQVYGLSGEVVRQVRTLEAQLSGAPRIWGLLGRGEVGWSVLKVAGPYIQEKDEAWWLELLPRVTRDQLIEIVKPLREKSRGASAATAPAPGPESSAEGDQLPGQLARAFVDPAGGSGSAGGESCAPGHSPSPPPEPKPGAKDATRPAIPDAPLSRTLRIPVDPLTEKRFRELVAERSRFLGRAVSQGEVLAWLLGVVRDASSATPQDQPAAPTPAAERKFLEVVFRSEHSGELFTRTPAGMVQVPREAYPAVLREGESLDFGVLKSAAVASASRTRGERLSMLPGVAVPAAVERFVRLRAGNYCERPGCPNLGEHLHHRRRRAEGGDHDPANIWMCCDVCHAALHAGLLRDDPASPTHMSYVTPGSPIGLGWVDSKVQSYRRQAWAGK